jgi:hypothetical protein
MTRVQVFIDSLRTRRTNTTRGLEILLANDPAAGQHPLFGTQNHQRLQAEGALSSGPNDTLPWWAKQALARSGLTIGEIGHIDHWPAAQRERVREAVLKAVNENTGIAFLWDLVDGDENDTDVNDSGGPIVVTFRSARTKVRFVGVDNVVVDV